MTTRQDTLDWLSSTAESIYADGPMEREHMPMAIAQFPDGKTAIIGIDLTGATEKDWRHQVRHLFETLAQRGAVRLAHIHESWMAKINPKAPPAEQEAFLAHIRQIGVSKLPPDDRMEILMLTIAERDQPLLGMIRPIIRGHGKASLGPSLNGSTGHRLSSRFLDDLPWT